MKRVSLLSLFVGLLGFGLLPCCAQDAPAAPSAVKEGEPARLPVLELPVPPEALKETGSLWYGLYMTGNKAGWCEESRSLQSVEGKPCVSITMKMHMEFKALENVMTVESTGIQHFTVEPPHRLLLLEERQKSGEQESIISVRHREGQTYDVTVTEAGQKRTREIKDLDLRLTHSVSPEIWMSDPSRKPGDAIGIKEFSTDEMAATMQTCTLKQEADWTGPGGKLPVWECDLYDFAHSMHAVGRVSKSDGSLVTAVFAGTIELRHEPEAVAKAMPDGDQADMFLAMMLRSNKKLGNATALRELTVELTAPEGRKLPAIPETANQSVEISPDGRTATVRVGKKHGKPQPVTEAERTACLAATHRYPVGEAKVKELAEKASAGAATEREKVLKILRFTDRYIKDSYETEPLTLLDLIAEPEGDCSAHSLLFTALARAAGIPAREAGGWMYMGDDYKGFGGHAWNEVALDGEWVPVDPTWKQMQLDAGHIQQHAGEPSGTMLEGMAGGLKLKVLSFGRK